MNYAAVMEANRGGNIGSMYFGLTGKMATVVPRLMVRAASSYAWRCSRARRLGTSLRERPGSFVMKDKLVVRLLFERNRRGWLLCAEWIRRSRKHTDNCD